MIITMTIIFTLAGAPTNILKHSYEVKDWPYTSSFQMDRCLGDMRLKTKALDRLEADITYAGCLQGVIK